MTEPQKTLTVLVQRQIDAITTGNGAYLETFLRAARAGGFHIRIIFAPWHSFGNRPFAAVHPRFRDLVDEFIWDGTVFVGGRYWSLAPRIWMRLVLRMVHAAMNRAGMKVMWRNYFGRPMRPSEVARLAATADRHASNITIAEYSSVGPVLDLLKQPTRKGVLVHDVLYMRADQFRRNNIPFDFYETNEAEESNWVKSADFFVYASANEMQFFPRGLDASRKVWLRPDAPAYGAVPSNGTPRVVFLGTTHAGNTDAINHFLTDIWPRVLEKCPQAEIHVAGSVGSTIDPALKNTRNLRLLGRVDRLEDIGGSYSIGIAPTRMATGVSIKVAEYLMLGMPVVAYPLALEGFSGALDGMVSVKETADDFADEVARLLSDDAACHTMADGAPEKTRRILSNDEVSEFLRKQAG